MVKNPNIESQKPSPKIPPLVRQVLRFASRWGLRVVIALVLISLLTSVLLQFPFFQQKAKHQLNSFLSSELKTEVRIGSLSTGWLDELTLNDVVIHDLRGDTLIHVQQLNAELLSTPLAWANRELHLGDVKIKNADLKIKREPEDSTSNLNAWVNELKPKKKKNRKQWNISLGTLFLDSLAVRDRNNYRGEEWLYNFPKGEIQMKELDIARSEVIIDDLKLNQPYFSVEKFQIDTARLIPFNKPPKEGLGLGTNVYVEVESLQVKGGTFKYDNFRRSSGRTVKDGIFDSDHWMAIDWNMEHKDIVHVCDTITSELVKMSMRENSGFELLNLKSKEFVLSDRCLIFNGAELRTPYSEIRDTIAFKIKKLSDFSQFNKKVRLDAKFNEATIATKDILYFFPALNENRFFVKNKKEVIEIDGRFRGKINSLKGDDLIVKLASGLLFKGNFNSNNLAVRDEEILNLKVEKLKTSIATLEELIPNFQPPKNFERLGNVDFNGRFDGFFHNFTASGYLKSDIGDTEMDMTLEYPDGFEKAKYSGKMNLIDFDLGGWTNDPQLGIINFNSNVRNGVGLTANTASADLDGTISSFYYRDYLYENVKIDGDLKNRKFVGQLDIKDDNIDLIFAGTVDFTEQIPRFDFTSNVKMLDLHALNITKEEYSFSGDLSINLVDSDLSNMEGDIVVKDFQMNRKGVAFEADTISISNHFDESQQKVFRVASDILDGEIKGTFDIEQIPRVMRDFLVRNYPQYSSRVGLRAPKKTPKFAEFEFDVKVKEPGNFLTLVDPHLAKADDFSINGYFHGSEEKLNFSSSFEEIKYKNVSFGKSQITANMTPASALIELGIDDTKINKTKIPNFATILNLQRGVVDFSLMQADGNQIGAGLNLDGQLLLVDNNFQVNFKPANLQILGQQWVIPPDNFVRFRKGYFETKDFRIENGDNVFVFESTPDHRGLAFSIDNFNLDIINTLWKYDPLNFSGITNITGKINDVFQMKDFRVSAISDAILVNEDDFGEMYLEANLADLKSRLNLNFAITKGEQNLLVDGHYHLSENSKMDKRALILRNKMRDVEVLPTFDFDVNVIKYPIKMIEYWVTNGISNTEGTITSTDLRVYGEPGKPLISGKANTENGRSTINYLNTTYDIVKGTLNLDNDMFSATGSIISDSEGNLAYVNGGLTHTYLKKLGLNVDLVADRFIALDTKKGVDAPFYGKGIGSGTIRFSGDFKQTDITVDAVTTSGTSIKIPIVTDYSTSDISFVRFVDKKKKEIKKEEDSISRLLSLRGINLYLNLSITDEAEMKLIFDERVGDEIIGFGNGDLEINVLRDGTFSMVGDYFIERGNYLFTMLNLLNKKFDVHQGGIIRWTGDPFGAEINLSTSYSSLNTPINNLILEYLELMPDDLKNEAGQATQVNLTMLLQGKLLKPTINFDIDFPELSGELRTYASSKIRLLKQDQNELNRQVFGLIVTGQFLPSFSNYISVVNTDLAVSTLSEVLANQISIYLTDILSDLITDYDNFSGIDFDLAFNTYQNADAINASQNLQNNTGSTVQVNLKPSFYNNRLSFNLGTQFNVDDDGGYGTTARAGAFSAGDFVVEYALSKDRRLKLKAYASRESVIGGGTRQRFGGGLSYRTQFDTYREFFDGMKSGVKTLRRKFRNNIDR